MSKFNYHVEEFRDPNAELIDCLNSIGRKGGRVIKYDKIMESHWCGLDEENEYYFAGWRVIYEMTEPEEPIDIKEKYGRI
jgi:hypothetical protein